MNQIDRFFFAALVVGVWSLVALEVTSITQAYAQQTPVTKPAQENGDTQNEAAVISASDIVGLSALIEKTIRDRQFSPQSMPGLEQYVKSVVRRCRISGSVRGDRISSANITC